MIKELKQILFLKKRYLLLVGIAFCFASYILQRIVTESFSPQNVAKKIEHSIQEKEKSFYSILNDTTFLKQLNCKQNNNFLYRYNNEPFGIFVYTFQSDSLLKLKAWSTNKFNLNDADKCIIDSVYVTEYENGCFEIIRKKVLTQQNNFVVIAVIPIKWQYFITNKYLTPKFDGFGQYYKYYQLEKKVNPNPIKSNNGNVLAYLKKTQQGPIIYYTWYIILLRLLGLTAFLIFINNFCNDVVKKVNFKIGFGILIGVIGMLRLLSYCIQGFCFNFKKLSLFDPSIYASNFLHRSLGDLLVNLLLIFWVVSFYKNNSMLTNKVRLWNRILRLGVVSFLTFGVVSVLKSLVIDSKISFNVSNFFSLDIYTGVALICICLLFINFYKIAQLLLQPIEMNKQNIIIIIFSLVIFAFPSGALLLNYKNDFPWLFLIIILIGFVFVLLEKNVFVRQKTSSDNSVTLSLKWILFFTFLASSLIIYFTKNLELEQRKKVAEKVYLQSDATVENLLNIAATGFSNAFFVFNMDRFKNEKETKFLRDSLVAENFSGYLNKFNTHIYMFDSIHKPINNIDTLSYNTLSYYISNAKQIIPDKNLYSFQGTSNAKTYLYKKELYNVNDKIAHTLFILFEEKKEKNNSVFPVLFKQWQVDDLLTNYAYAIYNNGKLIDQDGNYNFGLLHQNKGEKYQFRKERSKSILVYQPNSEKTIILVKTDRDLLDFITFFAYLFLSFLFIIFIFLVINRIVLSKFNLKVLLNSIQLNIRAQIRAVIIFVSLFSFLIIGVVTILFFIDKFNQTSQDRLVKSLNNISTQIVDLYKADTNYLKAKHEPELTAYAKQLGVDFNLFDSTGNLLFSTQPYIYNKKLVDARMNPIAYQKIFFNHESLFRKDEQISELNYSSLYKPLVNHEGKIVACINVPFLNAEEELENEISSFILTLMNLNAFIFLIAAAIAYFIANRITSSFKLIANKMKEVNWKEQSEEIVWTKKDEIGMLVDEYNVMVRKLHETAQAFALSQKEMAWKEMAQQVAHEIKNPLTPMKLSLQYLQKSIDNADPNVKLLSKKVSKTLIEQIDQLSKIAEDFSQFANIGNNKLEQLNLTDVINNVIQLFNIDDKVHIEHHQLQLPILIYNDKIQMVRLFTNIIKNAVEAVTGNELAQISISYELLGKHVNIAIQDNGAGISDDIASKMFTPNFTTKSSGTGLGLAICKGIVDHSNGKIWFETSGNGTIFYVQLPLM